MQTTQTDLQFLDITDPKGAIVERGTLTVNGTVNTNGADNGRWNLDFADGQTAHLIAQAPYDPSTTQSGTSYILSTADFSNPDQPKLDSGADDPVAGMERDGTLRSRGGCTCRPTLRTTPARPRSRPRRSRSTT